MRAVDEMFLCLPYLEPGQLDVLDVFLRGAMRLDALFRHLSAFVTIEELDQGLPKRTVEA